MVYHATVHKTKIDTTPSTIARKLHPLSVGLFNTLSIYLKFSCFVTLLLEHKLPTHVMSDGTFQNSRGSNERTY